MVMAGEVGESLGVTGKGTAARIRRVLESYGMPTESAFDFAKVVEATALDKKSFGKTLNLILLKADRRKRYSPGGQKLPRTAL